MLRRHSFTLIELLVAVAIMGALVLMAQGTYVIYMRDSLDATLKHNLFQLRAAIQQFYADHGRYPYDGLDHHGNAIGFLDTATSELTQGVRLGAGGAMPNERTRYLIEIPVDPSTNQINWRMLPHDGDGDWRTFDDTGLPGTANDFENGEGNGIWDGFPPEDPNDDVGGPDGYGEGDGKPTRGEPNVDEDGFGPGDGTEDNDYPDVRDVVSSNPDFEHL